MSTAYRPRGDSLPSLCIGFFTNNPDEELTLDDITQKFGTVRGNIHTQLRLAVEAGLLIRTADEEHGYIYRAGTVPDPRDNQTDADAAPRAKPGAPIKLAPRDYACPRHAIDLGTFKVAMTGSGEVRIWRVT